jgi:diketogulonate reductase-like aldo/keto reductase
VLSEIAARHNVTPHEVALAWLLHLASNIVPTPAATREVTARSIERVIALELTDDDRAQLDDRFTAGCLLRRSRPTIRPARSNGEVVIVVYARCR